MSDKECCAVAAEYAAGVKVLAIAASHGISDSYVRKIARRAGVPARSPQNIPVKFRSSVMYER